MAGHRLGDPSRPNYIVCFRTNRVRMAFELRADRVPLGQRGCALHAVAGQQ